MSVFNAVSQKNTGAWFLSSIETASNIHHASC
jgi:hypothetical protein